MKTAFQQQKPALFKSQNFKAVKIRPQLVRGHGRLPVLKMNYKYKNPPPNQGQIPTEQL